MGEQIRDGGEIQSGSHQGCSQLYIEEDGRRADAYILLPKRL